jgi:hypothetical protein
MSTATATSSVCLRRWPNACAATGTVSARPPAVKAWTSESGACASAAMCSAEPSAPAAVPASHSRERRSLPTVASGRRKSTAAAPRVPACCSR